MNRSRKLGKHQMVELSWFGAEQVSLTKLPGRHFLKNDHRECTPLFVVIISKLVAWTANIDCDLWA